MALLNDRNVVAVEIEFEQRNHVVGHKLRGHRTRN